MMKKKILALAMSIAMVATVFTGCGSTDAGNDAATADTNTASSEASTEAAADDELAEHVVLKWYLCGSNVTDDTEVLKAANEYLTEKLNCEIQPIWGTWSDFNDGAVLSLQSGEDVDIYFTCSWTSNSYANYAKDGYYVRLDDPENNLLEKYAPTLFNEVLPDALVKGAYVDGASGYGVYAVSGYKDIANQYCWDVNTDMLAKYGFTVDDVKEKGFYGFDEIFKTIKEGEEKETGTTFYPFMPETGVIERCVLGTAVVGNEGSLLSYYYNMEDPSKGSDVYGETFLNKFTSDEFKKMCDKMREYYAAGYIDPELITTEAETLAAHRNEHTYAIATQSYAYGYEVQASAAYGINIEFVPCMPPYMDTTSSQGAMMAISTASKNPERAMMFLNLLNTDPYLFTLLDYGVEGIHYNKNDIGEVEFIEEARSQYSPWTNGMGNVTLLPPQKGQGADFWDNFKAYYGSADEIPILGFTFNSENVGVEMGAVANAATEYALTLSVGAVDPDEVLPDFLKKLDDNGMQKIVDEANAQLKTYLENK